MNRMISPLSVRYSKALLASKGFTLIEILAILVIVGILAALTIPSSINTWGRIQQEEAADQITTALRSARTNAKASLTGREWVASVDTTGDVAVVTVQPRDELCNELLPCSTTSLPNLVDVVSTCDDDVSANANIFDVIFDSEGNLGVGENCTFGIKVDAVSRDLCVVTSTILGAIRNYEGSPECGDSGGAL